MKTSIVMFALILLVSLAQAEPVNNEMDYLQRAVQRYEQALQHCMEIQSLSGLPDSSVMTALKKYPADQANAFLITRAAEMEDVCAYSELADLAIVLHLIANSTEADEELSALQEQTRTAVFSHARWGLKQRYLSLPSDMKSDLEKHDIFQEPFNALLIREHLESESGAGIRE